MKSDAAAIRQAILARRDALTAAEAARHSGMIIRKLSSLPQLRNSRLPLLFISFRSEIDTRSLIKERLSAGEPVLVPRTIVKERRLEVYRITDWKRDIEKGAYGIPEPVPGVAEKITDHSLIDLVLVPGSVFDRHCGRFGYGGGFYDRFLSMDAPQAFRLGAAYSFQVLDSIPLAPHDEKMDMVITEKETISCKPNRLRNTP